MEASAHTALSPSPTIGFTTVDGLTVIIDLAAERYRVLDDSASLFWTAIVGGQARAETLDAMHVRFAVEPSVLVRDYDAFVELCLGEGLLKTAGDAGAQRAELNKMRGNRQQWWLRAILGSMPPTLRALSCLYFTRALLNRRGFGKAYNQIARPFEPGPNYSVPVLMRAFSRAEHGFVSARAPSDCLVRSLGLFLFLRSYGVEASHFIGASRHPFRAHAWVEIDGLPLLDDLARSMTPLARLNAAA